MKFVHDTIGKKITRLEVWLHIKMMMGDKAFKKARILVLAGPDGADLGIALNLGADPKNLLAIDISRECVTRTKWLYPEVRVEKKHLAKLIDEGKERPFDVLFLDFCSPMSEQSLSLVNTAIIGGGTPDAIFAYTFLCGREMPGDPAYSRIFAKQADLPRASKVAQLSRADVVANELYRRTRRSGRIPMPLHYWFYQSKDEDDGRPGIPMGVYLAQMTSLEYTTREDVERSISKSNKSFIKPVKADLIKRALMLEQMGLDASLMLNVAPGTVAAWKAHATRGTYS